MARGWAVPRPRGGLPVGSGREQGAADPLATCGWKQPHTLENEAEAVPAVPCSGLSHVGSKMDW